MKNYKNFLLEQENKLKPKVKLDFPEFRQVFNYDCDVTALQQILIYYGIEKREEELIELLKPNKTHGTKISKVIEISKYFGLEAEVLKNTTIEKVKSLIDEGIPPLLLVQSWRDYSTDNLDWRKDYNDGHTVIAIGYNDFCIFFEDPASVNRTYLTYEELEKRWHDIGDDNKTKIHKVAIVIRGEKKYNSKNIIHMD